MGGAVGHASNVAALTVAAVFWGLAPVANRYLVVGQLSPWHLLVVRLAIASLTLAPLLVRVRRLGLGGRDWTLLTAGGLAAVLGYYVPVTVGAQWIPAGVSGLLITAEPIFIVLLSVLVLRERQPWRVLAGVLGGAAGVALLVGWTPGGGGGPLYRLGSGLTLFGALMWAVYTLLLGPLSRRLGALYSTALTTILGTLPLLTLARGGLQAAAGLSPPAWGGLLLLALGGTALGTVLWSYGLARVPAARAGAFLYLQPLISVLGGSLLLGERVGLSTLLGGALILAGVALAQVPAVISTN